MMLSKTFKKLDEVFDALSKELKDVFGQYGGVSATTVGDLTVVVYGGNVDIKGPIKELRINGRVVRFPGGKP